MDDAAESSHSCETNNSKSTQDDSKSTACETDTKPTQPCDADALRPDQRPFTLMKLPAELRVMVYKEIDAYTLHHFVKWEKQPRSALHGTGADSPTRDDSPEDGTEPLGFKLVRFALPIQLLQVSRQIYAEAVPILRSKAALIPKIVPKMIVYVSENDFPRGVGLHITNIRLWFEELMKNPQANFDDFAKLKPKESLGVLRSIQQAGLQMFLRYRNARRPGASPVPFYHIDFRVHQDGPQVPCWCELDTNNASPNEEYSLDDQVHRVLRSVFKVAGRRLQPKDAIGNPYLNIRTQERCGCPDPTRIATLCPGWSSPNYTAASPSSPTDEKKGWEKFEWERGWVEGEVL